MKIILHKKPKNPTIIEGFPGFGLIGTITTEFLIEHLKAKEIGSFEYDSLPAIVAVHQEKLVNPMGVFYAEKENIIILHTILNTQGVEWKLCDSILNMVKTLNAPEIVCLEGVSSKQTTDNSQVYYYATSPKSKQKLSKIKDVKSLKESIILGVSGALMLRSHIPVTCFFAETHLEFPDSKAASNIVKILDSYLGLKVDYKPLLAQAKEFEEKFKTIMEQSSIASKVRDKKQMSYLG
ncbi:MAG: PAC2 family protein [Nanoarchaeota archaeon]|nr:PAC2 family protein [Nanoarchaeota archaeon]